eukprot:7514531-Heterocapsa_arctica.AAC.1
MIEDYYLNHHATMGSLLMIVVDEVYRDACSRRLLLGYRWTGASWESLLELPATDVIADLPGLPAAGAAGGEQALPEVPREQLFVE